MQKARILGGLAAGVVLLLCAVLFAVWLLVNPNNYQGMIAAAVKESTGRDLQLSGDIKLSVFPRVALEVGSASLGDRAGFADQPLLAFTHAALVVKLLPLLRRRLEVTRVEIDGLDLRLRRNAQGRGNWEEVSAASQPAPSVSVGANRPPQSVASFPAVRIHGRASYEDISLDHLNLETGAAAQNRDIPIRITFDANRGVPGEQLMVNARFDIRADSTQPLRLAAVNLSGTLSRSGDDRPVPWELSAPALVVNPSRQTAETAAFTLSYANARLAGSMAATKMLEDLSLTGSATLAPLVLREFGPRVGIAIPPTRDPKAWSQLSGSADIAYASKTWSLTNIRAQLDDTQLQGNIDYSAADAETVQFDLAVDHIDLDRYRTTGGSAASHLAKDSDQASNQVKKPFKADGTLTAAAASFSGMDFSKLRLTLASKDSVTHLFPIEAQIDGGRCSGDITLDDRAAVRILSIDAHLTGIDMARLLAKSAQKGRLSGRATLNLKGTARGGSMDAFLRTLSGHLEADLAEGALEGIDLEYERNRAQALIDRTPNLSDDTKRTQFDAFKTSAEISNGIAETHNLTISSQALRVLGRGSANLSTKAINFQLLASILQSPTKTLVDIPFKVTGTYADPTVKADIDSLAKDQLKQKLQDILKKNGLQGLFGK